MFQYYHTVEYNPFIVETDAIPRWQIPTPAAPIPRTSFNDSVRGVDAALGDPYKVQPYPFLQLGSR